MSSITARRNLIESYLFSDNLNFWIIQANSFKKSADILKQTKIMQKQGVVFGILNINKNSALRLSEITNKM